jgi:tRNA G18 (ribose-2'-O)-methylase SpoU
MAARIVAIESVDRPELEPYLRMRDRDLARAEMAGSGRGGDGLFVAEGEVVVRMLASERSRFRVCSLFVEQRRVDSLSDVTEALGEDVSVYAAPQEIMDSAVGFHIHRGILALGERGAPLAADALLGVTGAESKMAVGLVGLANHDNVGSVFRNAAAFGARGVLLDAATCDPLYRKSIRVSVGAALVVPFARCPSATALLDTIEASGWEPLALSARGDETLDAVVHSASSARGRVLLLGTEGDGLPADVLARSRRVRIDMMPTLDSLNVAVASGIALYEATRGRS